MRLVEFQKDREKDNFGGSRVAFPSFESRINEFSEIRGEIKVHKNFSYVFSQKCPYISRGHLFYADLP